MKFAKASVSLQVFLLIFEAIIWTGSSTFKMLIKILTEKDIKCDDLQYDCSENDIVRVLYTIIHPLNTIEQDSIFMASYPS